MEQSSSNQDWTDQVNEAISMAAEEGNDHMVTLLRAMNPKAMSVADQEVLAEFFSGAYQRRGIPNAGR